MSAPPPHRVSKRRATNVVLVGVFLDLVVAAGIGIIRTAGSSTGMSRAEGPLPTIALVFAVAAPGIVALVGLATGRPVLYGAAGIACGPLVLVSIAAVPVWIPGVLFLIAFVGAQTAEPTFPLWTGLILGGFPIPLLAGVWILVTETAQYSYSYQGGSESGDYFTAGHAVTCITIVAADIALVSLLARATPARRRAARAVAISAPTSRSACGS